MNSLSLNRLSMFSQINQSVLILIMLSFIAATAKAAPPRKKHEHPITPPVLHQNPTDFFGKNDQTERSNQVIPESEEDNELRCRGFLRTARDLTSTAKEDHEDGYQDSFFAKYDSLLDEITPARKPEEVTAPSKLIKPVGSIIARWVEGVMIDILKPGILNQNQLRQAKAVQFKKVYRKMYQGIFNDFNTVTGGDDDYPNNISPVFQVLADSCP